MCYSIHKYLPCNNLSDKIPDIKLSLSSVTGGVFDLEHGENVLVTMSGQGIVELDTESSHLGLFLLSTI